MGHRQGQGILSLMFDDIIVSTFKGIFHNDQPTKSGHWVMAKTMDEILAMTHAPDPATLSEEQNESSSEEGSEQ